MIKILIFIRDSFCNFLNKNFVLRRFKLNIISFTLLENRKRDFIGNIMDCISFSSIFNMRIFKRKGIMTCHSHNAFSFNLFMFIVTRKHPMRVNHKFLRHTRIKITISFRSLIKVNDGRIDGFGDLCSSA